MRSTAAGRMMNELGGELKEAYLTFGGYDFRCDCRSAQ